MDLAARLEAAGARTPAGRAATTAAGAAGRRRPRAADPRATAPGSAAARQREEIERIKAEREAREAAAAAAAAPPAPQEPASPDPASPGPGRSAPAMPAAVSSGSGFLLGVFLWAIARAYIGNDGQPAGMDGVKRFVRAKFFNEGTEQ